LLQEEITPQTTAAVPTDGVHVIALPINIIAGLFGMNVHIPFNQDDHGFDDRGVVAATAAALWIVLRRPGN
jgi:Mg2+ and Co2+ transporter CorA